MKSISRRIWRIIWGTEQASTRGRTFISPFISLIYCVKKPPCTMVNIWDYCFNAKRTSPARMFIACDLWRDKRKNEYLMTLHRDNTIYKGPTWKKTWLQILRCGIWEWPPNFIIFFTDLWFKTGRNQFYKKKMPTSSSKIPVPRPPGTKKEEIFTLDDFSDLDEHATQVGIMNIVCYGEQIHGYLIYICIHPNSLNSLFFGPYIDRNVRMIFVTVWPTYWLKVTNLFVVVTYTDIGQIVEINTVWTYMGGSRILFVRLFVLFCLFVFLSVCLLLFFFVFVCLIGFFWWGG